MSTITIIEGNSNDKDNTRAYMVKGESGVSPTVSSSRSGTTTTVTMTDYEGTHTFDVEDGVSPTVATSKQNGVTTITITDASGTHTATINDGEISEAELEAGLATKFDKAGGTLTGDINYTQGSKGIYWKEGNYGDKFKIFPDFTGADDSNVFKIQGAVGGQGTDPDLYDLVTVTGKSGNMDVKGTITANNSRVITRGDFAIITGSLAMTDGSASESVNYPTGFDSTNCVILSFMAHNSTSTASVANYGYTEKSIGYSSGAIGHRIGLKTDGIAVNINNPMSDTGTATFAYTIVLMKVS